MLGLGLELALGSRIRVLGLRLELGLGLEFERLQWKRNSQFNPCGPFRRCYLCLFVSPIC